MIERIEIHNFKSIKDAQIDLKRVNILIGANGAGKSNFITFFELTRQMLEQCLGAYMLEHGGIDSMLYHGRKYSGYISAMIDFDDRNAFAFMLKPTQGAKAYIQYTRDYFNSKSLPGKNYETWEVHERDANVEETAILTHQQQEVGYISEFLRSFTVYHFHDTGLSSPMRRPSRVGDNRFLRHDGSNIAAFLYMLKKSDIRSYNLIEGTIRSIAPFFKGFVLNPDKTMEGYITLQWEEKDSDMYLDAHNFSDGTLRFIALATLLLQPEPPKTIIIDEPELGLHPAAINKLCALINRASLKSQLIVATQSVNIVDCFAPEDIMVVNRTNGQSTFDRLDTSLYSHWLEEYSLGEVWEKNIIGGQP